MATNGNDPRLQQLEETLREAVPPPPVVSENSNLIAMVDALTHRCHQMARSLAGNAEADSKDTQAFAEHVRGLFRKWGEELIARKRAELAELEKFIGRVRQ